MIIIPSGHGDAERWQSPTLISQSLPAVCIRSEAIVEQIDKDIWVEDGPNVSFLGLSFPTRMTVIRLGSELWIHSPVSLSSSASTELEELGEVRYVLSPNKYHHMFLSEWRSNYPEAELYASPGLTSKRPDIRFDRELRATETYAWSETIAHEVFGPSLLLDEVVYFHRPSRTLVLTDLIVNIKTNGYNWWQKLFAEFDGLCYPGGTTPRLYRWSMKSRTTARRVYRSMMEWDPQRVIISHGEWFRNDGKNEIEARLGWVL